MPDISNPPGLTKSGDVDHDETSNRTHDGDDLSPATLEAGTITDGANVSHTGELADSVDVSSIQSSGDVTVTDTQTGSLSDGEYLQNSGGTLVGAGVQGGFSNIEVFEADGTFDASNVDLVFAEVVGGGGDGGDSNDEVGEESGSGGGGGGYSAAYIDLSQQSSIPITVGNSGQSSSFGSYMSATGGESGQNSVEFSGQAGGAGGEGIGGDINSTGSAGAKTMEDDRTGGAGGSSVYGGGARGGTDSPGFDAVGYGGGGGGAGGAAASSGTGYGRGDGANGAVIVRY